ncbi:MAG TPA: SDR family oxidoreductase [Candidatus Limnocylindrales bacterium]|nr:SDR family oxidoreductase [Candidatus Limnocylindrales bacterium]
MDVTAHGFMRSNPTTGNSGGTSGSEGQRKLIENIALKRLGSPQDIANGVLFFASGHAGWITGQTLVIDGGR